MRVELIQIDTRDTNKKNVDEVEKALNDVSEKAERNGFFVVNEQLFPETTSVKNYFMFTYEKGEKLGLRYKFLVFDVRGSMTVVNNELNAEILRLEKEGKQIVRSTIMPQKNTAFVQILLAHIPKKKIKEEL